MGRNVNKNINELYNIDRHWVISFAFRDNSLSNCVYLTHVSIASWLYVVLKWDYNMSMTYNIDCEEWEDISIQICNFKLSADERVFCIRSCFVRLRQWVDKFSKVLEQRKVTKQEFFVCLLWRKNHVLSCLHVRYMYKVKLRQNVTT